MDPDGNEQRVHRALTPSLTVTDLSALAPDARRERLRALEDEDGRRPFDLAKGPLWRASLVKLAPREHVLGLYVHHVVVDGWSVALLLEELQAILAGTRRGEPPAMPFSAYAAWRDATRDSPERREALTTYRERLGAVKPTLDIPLDRPRPRLPTFAGGRERLVLPRATLDAYKRAATRGGVTFFMWLMAGFGALLHRLTGQRELLLGYPRAVRSGPESQGVIGHATTLLPVLSRIDATTSFAEYKGAIGGELAESHGQDPVPFGALVRALGVVNHDGRPYVRALFNLEGGRRAPAPAGGLSFEPLRRASRSPASSWCSTRSSRSPASSSS